MTLRNEIQERYPKILVLGKKGKAADKSVRCLDSDSCYCVVPELLVTCLMVNFLSQMEILQMALFPQDSEHHKASRPGLWK